MPFVQMENISHFLRLCQSPPLSLQPHDVFQTVDLYEAKDPAQVLQCIGAFSRRAHAVQPAIFPRAIGGKSKGIMSPQGTGGKVSADGNYSRGRGYSGAGPARSATPNPATPRNSSPAITPEPHTSTPVKEGLPASPPIGVSSWSKRTDEGATIPAWNIHQYGYMGGASQGNQGISFGGRRQITTPAPKVPSVAEKERRRREADAEAQRRQLPTAEAERKRQVDREAKEERDRAAEEERPMPETRVQGDRDEAHADVGVRKMKEAESRREKQVASPQTNVKGAGNWPGTGEEDPMAVAGRETAQSMSRDARLNGQFLSQYHAEQRKLPPTPGIPTIPSTAERRRLQEPEQELGRTGHMEKFRHAEGATGSDGLHDSLSHDEFQAVSSPEHDDSPGSFRQENYQRSSKSRPLPPVPPNSHHNSDEPGLVQERDYLRGEWAAYQNGQYIPDMDSPSPPPPSKSSRPLPTPQTLAPSLPARPLPVPQASPPRAIPSFPTNPSSLLAREMERDRLRQREWEEAQQATKLAAATNGGRLKDRQGGATGAQPGDGAWDVNQYGYLGGDNQNRGGPGLGIGARRQIIGPRVEVRKG